MKILEKILIGLCILVAIILIAALFVKNDYAIEKEIVVNKPRQDVFNYIRYVKNQDHFIRWASLDPGMKRSYTGTDGTVGFIATWESSHDEVGKGEQEIMKIVEGERIDLEFRFMEPFVGTEPAYMTTETFEGNKTRIKWGFSGHIKYPLNITMVFWDLEQMVGKDLETGLGNLKTVLEK